MQVCGDSHGGSGPAADGLSLPEHQTLRGEFSAHGGQTAGVQRTRPAGPGNQLGKKKLSVWLEQEITSKHFNDKTFSCHRRFYWVFLFKKRLQQIIFVRSVQNSQEFAGVPQYLGYFLIPEQKCRDVVIQTQTLRTVDGCVRLLCSCRWSLVAFLEPFIYNM